MKTTLTLILAFIVSAGMAQVNKHKDTVATKATAAVLHLDSHAILGGFTSSGIPAEKYPEAWTDEGWRYEVWHGFPTITVAKPQFVVLYQTQPKIILSVSSPDSAGVTTVKFSKSQVHFINDSTFTFKVK